MTNNTEMTPDMKEAFNKVGRKFSDVGVGLVAGLLLLSWNTYNQEERFKRLEEKLDRLTPVTAPAQTEELPAAQTKPETKTSAVLKSIDGLVASAIRQNQASRS